MAFTQLAALPASLSKFFWPCECLACGCQAEAFKLWFHAIPSWEKWDFCLNLRWTVCFTLTPDQCFSVVDLFHVTVVHGSYGPHLWEIPWDHAEDPLLWPSWHHRLLVQVRDFCANPWCVFDASGLSDAPWGSLRILEDPWGSLRHIGNPLTEFVWFLVCGSFFSLRSSRLQIQPTPKNQQRFIAAAQDSSGAYRGAVLRVKEISEIVLGCGHVSFSKLCRKKPCSLGLKNDYEDYEDTNDV